jgi:hypothetical protein
MDDNAAAIFSRFISDRSINSTKETERMIDVLLHHYV